MRRNGTSSRAGLDGDFRGTMALSLNQLQRYPSKPLRVLQAVRKEPNPKQYLARLLTNR
jgi:hypothetical protein